MRTNVYRCAPRCAEGGDSWRSGREISNARGLVRKVGLAGRLYLAFDRRVLPRVYQAGAIGRCRVGRAGYIVSFLMSVLA